jgi:hypothetical protein
MNSIRSVAVIVTGLLLALWWAVQPPRPMPPTGGPLEAQKQAQCPANTTLHDKLCTCPEGTSWTDSQCMQVWSSADASPRRG